MLVSAGCGFFHCQAGWLAAAAAAGAASSSTYCPKIAGAPTSGEVYRIAVLGATRKAWVSLQVFFGASLFVYDLDARTFSAELTSLPSSEDISFMHYSSVTNSIWVKKERVLSLCVVVLKRSPCERGVSCCAGLLEQLTGRGHHRRVGDELHDHANAEGFWFEHVVLFAKRFAVYLALIMNLNRRR